MKTLDDALRLRRPAAAGAGDGRAERRSPARAGWLTVAIVGAGADRRRDRRSDPRAGRARRSAPASGGSIPSRCGCCWSTRGHEPLHEFGDRAVGDRRARARGSWASSCAWASRSRAVDAESADPRRPGRPRADRGAHGDLGGGRPGVAARAHAGRRRRARRAIGPAGSRCCPTARCPNHPRVFAIGDMVSLDRAAGRRRGGDAAGPVRRQDASAAAWPAGTTCRRSSTATSEAWRPSGRFRAVVSVRGLRFGGVMGWLTWAFIHITFLTGFANRFSALLHWMRTSSRPRPQPAGLQRALHAPVASALSGDVRIASRADLAWRHCDQVPAPTSSFHVVLYVGSEILCR